MAAPGATVAGAKSELQGIAKRLEQQYPRTNTNFGATVIALQENLVGDVRPALLALEVGFGQANAVAEIATEASGTVELVRDLAGIDRVVCVRWE